MARRTIGAAAILASTVASGFADDATILALSHQWSTSDPRHQVAQMLADELHEQGVGLDVRVHPATSLMGPAQQYDALGAGDLALAIMPLAYAVERRPEYALTVLPGLARDHDHAERLAGSAFMAELEALMAEDGIVVVAHGFLASGLVGREACTVEFGALSAVEASFAELSSVNWTTASSGSGGIFADGLIDRKACYTAPGQTLPSIIYQPLLMSAAVFDTLTAEQQRAIRETAASVQEAYRDEAELQDRLILSGFRDAGVVVREMLPHEFETWRGDVWRAVAPSFVDDPASVHLFELALSVN